jgi:N-acetylglucosaminyl-diphospho-decaprenol L-rhamnosyltransferase
MILSVVIVNYNVKYFLEQCLSSLKKAVDGSSLQAGQTEVFIVDNCSVDGSMDFLIPLFPEFHFIRNEENRGFARANNQALAFCTGEFILFLNPDTILAEDTLDICLSFIRSTPDAGALGVHMIDGAGRYLNESKRGFPSPSASFFKMSGLAGLFPRSRVFSAYYLGHLREGSPHRVDILSGAFMMVKKSILDNSGGFDERYFMYAEDIDLSYQIRLAGFQNYYLSGTSIIHFKGESTRKDFRYVKMFYDAMELFIKKHFKGVRSSLQLFSLKMGIWIHQALAYVRVPFKKSMVKTGKLSRVFIQGDAGMKRLWKQALDEQTIPVSENIRDAEEIIFCEGPFQSWKSIIAEISVGRKRCLYKFHGSGTHAAVGSQSSREQGDVFEL